MDGATAEGVREFTSQPSAMHALGIEGVTRRRFKTGTTKREAGAKAAPDLVNRDFSAEGPDELWVADIARGAPGLAGCTSPRCSMRGAGGSLAGRWRPGYRPSWWATP
ncbi:MAG: hypothetical protein OXH08_10305 [Gammaproteobacteria bacterium]|nr:hypothetical protein [Gammaproteobacteria bacterium]MDE0650614.1 hypothetical protein [Gammaproteobacteria bacterium]